MSVRIFHIISGIFSICLMSNFAACQRNDTVRLQRRLQEELECNQNYLVHERGLLPGLEGFLTGTISNGLTGPLTVTKTMHSNVAAYLFVLPVKLEFSGKLETSKDKTQRIYATASHRFQLVLGADKVKVTDEIGFTDNKNPILELRPQPVTFNTFKMETETKNVFGNMFSKLVHALKSTTINQNQVATVNEVALKNFLAKEMSKLLTQVAQSAFNECGCVTGSGTEPMTLSNLFPDKNC